MNEKTENREGSINESSFYNDAEITNTVSKEADEFTVQTTLTKARDVIPSSEDFKHPLIKEYLGDKDVRTGVLSKARIINGGNFGPSAIVCIDGEMYRSGGEVFVKHVKALIEDGRFPFEVDVKRVTGKNDRTYYSL